jgi:hypothetical protein
MKKGTEMEFLHLCHQKNDTVSIHESDSLADDCIQ